MTQLEEKHGDKYTRFQYRLWAEMLATGVHTETKTPPVASVFCRKNKRVKIMTKTLLHGPRLLPGWFVS